MGVVTSLFGKPYTKEDFIKRKKSGFYQRHDSKTGKIRE